MRAGFFGVRRRVVFRRWVAVSVGAALAMSGLLVVPVSPVSAGPVSCPSSVADVASAVRTAKSCAGRVEVLSARSQTRQVFANPDGSSTVEESVVPARVRRRDGSWADVDPTLVASGGGWVPRASTLDVSFSNGGAGPFATYRSTGQTLTLSWPLGSLPEPTVSGDSVVYRGVLAGVDLWVTVSATSFRPVLAVADAAAAANPALRSVAFGVGGSVRALSTSDGRVRFADGSNRTVAETEAATMWDAASATTSGATTPGARVAAAEATSDARHAGDFARVAKVEQATGGHDLTIRPDAAMLTSPSTRWPLFIDPGISPSQTRFAYADSCNANNDQSSARVGLNPTDGCRYRSYFTMPVSQSGLGWMGKQVISAEFDIELDHSYSCGDTPAWVYNTSGITASPRMPWSGTGSVGMPASGGVSASGHANEDGGCGVADQGDMLMRFSGTAFLNQVKYAATQYWPDFTIGLCACDSNGNGESTQSYWKRFYIDSRAKLIVSYDTVPGAPANLTTSGTACGSAVGTTSPTLSAQAVDADGGDTLSAMFQWQQLPSGTVNSVPRTSIPANNFSTVPLSLGSGADGQFFQWRVQTTDASGYPSPWSGWCTFNVAAGVPPLPTVVPSGSPSYVACNPATIGTCTSAGGPGVPGSVILGPNGFANITSFTFGFSNPPTTTVTVSAGASTTVTVTPPHYGLNTLYVMDSNGTKVSGVKPYQFLVGAPSANLAYWPLDTYNGHNFTDQVSFTPLTAGNAVSWTPDARYIGDSAASFNGDSDHSTATGTVAGLDTTKSFSVAAWVRPTVLPTGNMTALGLDAGGTGDDSAFYLGLRMSGTPSAPHWSVRVQDTSSSAGRAVGVGATAALDASGVGKWTYLVAVYDAGQKRVGLYVNGVLAGTVDRAATPWQATGPLTIGRGLWNGGTTDGWRGQIADVRVWNRVVTTDDLWGTDADPANGVPATDGLMTPVQVGSWDFPGDQSSCGSPSPNGATFGHDVFLDPGCANTPPTSAFVADSHNGNGALWTAVGPGTASTTDPSDNIPHPVLRTDQSFTVSAWFKLDSGSLPARNETLVSQDGTAVSGFFLQYNYSHALVPGWEFVVPGSDVSSPTLYGAWTSGATTDWTHLAGVYDAGAGTVKLYVNGVLAATHTGVTTFQANGSLRLNQAWWNSGLSDGVGGTTDQVQVWQGVLTDRQITKLFQDSR